MTNVPRKFFVTYGDKRFRKAKKLIIKEAKKLNIFDEVISFSEKDLPPYITASPLFAFERGGGYWIWKPYIVHHVLSKKMKEGDILVYVDSGCQVNPSEQWDYYFNLMKDHNGIFFSYHEQKGYRWKEFGFPESLKIGSWTKQIAINAFAPFSEGGALFEKNEMLSGFLFVKKDKKQQFTEEWLKTMLIYPELVIDDLYIEKLKHTYPDYQEHRHDQTLLTLLVYLLKDSNNLLVLEEQIERLEEGAVLARRRKDRFLKSKFRVSLSENPVILKIYFFIKKKCQKWEK